MSFDNLLSSVESAILLVGCDYNTSISITPTQSVSLPLDAQSSTSSMISVPAGSSHALVLNQMQTLLVESSDLTGTKIVSDKPLTVISEHSRAVHIPPTSMWGKSFLLVPFGERSGIQGQYYKVIASEDETSFTRTCNFTSNTSVLPTAGDFKQFFTNPTTLCSLVSNKPVLVFYFVAGVRSNFNQPGINSIVSPVPSMDQFADYYSFSSLDHETNLIGVSVLPEFYEPSRIFLDGRPIAVNWNAIYNNEGTTVGYGCHVNVSGGSVHTVRHDNPSGRLAVMVFGFTSTTARVRRYSYLAGLRFHTSQMGTLITWSWEIVFIPSYCVQEVV